MSRKAKVAREAKTEAKSVTMEAPMMKPTDCSERPFGQDRPSAGPRRLGVRSHRPKRRRMAPGSPRSPRSPRTRTGTRTGTRRSRRTHLLMMGWVSLTWGMNSNYMQVAGYHGTLCFLGIIIVCHFLFLPGFYLGGFQAHLFL